MNLGHYIIFESGFVDIVQQDNMFEHQWNTVGNRARKKNYI